MLFEVVVDHCLSVLVTFRSCLRIVMYRCLIAEVENYSTNISHKPPKDITQ